MTKTAPNELYLVLENDGSLKVGTCNHCVVSEKGRPARAWDAEGDLELDFNRDELITRLQTLGVQVDIVEQYVCP